jgi:3,4-dihydroxy 2-butanone 4-phosphate synthase/GTP cyclohydrolase II
MINQVIQFLNKVERESIFNIFPLVTLTYAQSIDGSIAYRRGAQLILSGHETSQMTHALRAFHDGILVGIGTVMADDPRLTVRHVEGPNPQPIIMDSKLRFPLDATLLSNNKRPWIFTGPQISVEKSKVLREGGAEVFSIEQDEDGLDLEAFLKKIKELGVNRLMVEGGAKVIQSFLRSGLADAAVITVTPYFVGGLKAIEKPLGKVSERPRFAMIDSIEAQKMGSDILVYGRISKEFHAIS